MDFAMTLCRLPRIIYWLCRHVCWALANGKSFFPWLRALMIGVFPPLLWTFCFKQAARVPDAWRPAIHTWILPPADDALMSGRGVALMTLFLSPIGWYLWHSAHGVPFPSWHGRISVDTSASSPSGPYWRILQRDIELSTPSTPLSSSLYEAETHTLAQVPNGRGHLVQLRQVDESWSPDMSSSSTLVGDYLCEQDCQIDDKDDDDHDEGMMKGWRKVYAVCIMTYPSLLYVMHVLAFSGIRDYKDLMAWTTYGALHFASPIACAWWLWFFAPAGVARTFGWCLGCQNIAGVITHLSFPNAAPWFYDVYGPSLHPDPPPDYTYSGNPAGLVRVDKLLGTRLYANGFKKSPVVFGAFPSLHAATAVICALFVARYSRRKGLVFMMVYTYWMFWSTMYFHHHYAVDLIGGTIYACISFLVALKWVLPGLELDHELDYRTIGWDRTFLGRGFFGTTWGQGCGSGHWIGELPKRIG